MNGPILHPQFTTKYIHTQNFNTQNLTPTTSHLQWHDCSFTPAGSHSNNYSCTFKNMGSLVRAHVELKKFFFSVRRFRKSVTRAAISPTCFLRSFCWFLWAPSTPRAACVEAFLLRATALCGPSVVSWWTGRIVRPWEWADSKPRRTCSRRSTGLHALVHIGTQRSALNQARAARGRCLTYFAPKTVWNGPELLCNSSWRILERLLLILISGTTKCRSAVHVPSRKHISSR